MTTETHNLINAVEDVKGKLNDQEYKTILDTTMKIHNQDRSQPAVNREPSPQTEMLGDIMELLGGYNFRAYQNIVSTDEDTRYALLRDINRDIIELQRHKMIVLEKEMFKNNAYYWLPNESIESTIKDLSTILYQFGSGDADITLDMVREDPDCFAKDRILFYYYMGEHNTLIDQVNQEALAEWFEWIEDDEDWDEGDEPHYLEMDFIYNNEIYSDDRYTIKDWYKKMFEARQQAFAIANWISEINAY